jgi:hypothetical protein
MMFVTVEIGEGALTQRLWTIAPSIVRALKISRTGEPGRRVSLVFPRDPGAFYAAEGSGQREAA